MQNNQSIIDYIKYPLWDYWYDAQDPRTAHLPLVYGPPYLVLAILGAYLYFVTSLGPRLMANRNPLSLRPLMLFYNLSIVVFNVYFVSLVARHSDYGRRLFDWNYPDRSIYNAEVKWIIETAWWYWMSKFFELFNTIYFVLRKKHKSHITFAHLYHHTLVPIFGYLVLKHNGMVPCAAFFILINGIAHVINNSYFTLSLMGPTVRRYLWWKGCVTLVLMTEYVCYIVYFIAFTVKQKGYPLLLVSFFLTQPFVFLCYAIISLRKNIQERKRQIDTTQVSM